MTQNIGQRIEPFYGSGQSMRARILRDSLVCRWFHGRHSLLDWDQSVQDRLHEHAAMVIGPGNRTAVGSPSAIARRWYRAPCLPWSVRLAPVSSPPFVDPTLMESR